MERLVGRTFAIVDVETSGMSPLFSRVIEIGILRIEDGVCVERYKTCINPGHTISPWITSLTGIQPQDVENAPTFEDIIDDVERLLSGAVFVAHNARFDYVFLQSEFKRAGRLFCAKRLCTVRLSRALVPRAKKHGLSSIIDRYGFVCESRHRAYDDAKVLWDLLQLFHTRFGSRLTDTIDRLITDDNSTQQEFLRFQRALEERGEAVIR